MKTSPLCCAALFLPVDCVKMLVDTGADVNLVDDDRETALMAAAAVGESKCVRFLLERGADLVTASLEEGYGTALEAALEKLKEDEEEEKECVWLLGKRAVVILKELKRRADAGDPTAQEILSFEKQTRGQDVADESAQEEGEQTELENGLGNLNLGGGDSDGKGGSGDSDGDGNVGDDGGNDDGSSDDDDGSSDDDGDNAG